MTSTDVNALIDALVFIRDTLKLTENSKYKIGLPADVQAQIETDFSGIKTKIDGILNPVAVDPQDVTP